MADLLRVLLAELSGASTAGFFDTLRVGFFALPAFLANRFAASLGSCRRFALGFLGILGIVVNSKKSRNMRPREARWEQVAQIQCNRSLRGEQDEPVQVLREPPARQSNLRMFQFWSAVQDAAIRYFIDGSVAVPRVLGWVLSRGEFGVRKWRHRFLAKVSA